MPMKGKNTIISSSHSKLAILILFCFALVGARIFYSGTSMYLFLIWNLFLGVIPYLLSKCILGLYDSGSKWSSLILTIPCILFLPNAPYIVTDLFHLRMRSGVPIWFDCVMIFSFALAGLVLFYRSLENLEQVSRQVMTRRIAWLSSTIIIFASAFGMYLGRYLRFNSWDIVSDPFYLISEIAQRFISPFEHTQAWGMTMVYGLFLSLVYFFIVPSRQLSHEG